MRSVVALLGILIVVSLSSQTANACTCAAKGTPCDSYGLARAVFVGTVVAVRENERPKQTDRSEPDWEPMAYRFSVEQSYLGVAGTEVEVFTGRGGGDCGFRFGMGQRYLVYAYGDKLSTTICTRTTSFSQANEDLAFLGTLATTAPGVTIYGAISDHREGKNGPLSPDVLIKIEGESERKETRPDGVGNFRVSGLRPGKYKVSLKLPDTLTTFQREEEITVADRGCAEFVWYVRDNGRVSGRVINADGEPVARIMVSLEPADTEGKDQDDKTTRTDNDGQFMFSAVPRGRYIMAVNHDNYPDPKDPTTAYPPSFYPGVIDQAHAQVINVGAGEKLTNFDVRIPSKRPASILSGRVIWSDDSPVVNAQLSVNDVTQGEGFSYAVAADEQGRFKIEGYVGQKFVIEARSNRPHAPGNRPMERVGTNKITLERPAETLIIVITKLR
jgi:hypothetical protein